MKIEELAGKAGLCIGTYFVTGGRLYRVGRFTPLRIYLESFPFTLPSDGATTPVAGNQDRYIEVGEYFLKPHGDPEAPARWAAKMAEQIILIPETDLERVTARIKWAGELAAPITEQISAEMERHRSVLKGAQLRRQSVVREALTGGR